MSMESVISVVAKFNGKYRIESARLKDWDYGSNASYFVTICTKHKRHFFGAVINGKMNHSNTGKIADECWKEIPDHFMFVELGEYVIMPNHVHGIITINKPSNLHLPSSKSTLSTIVGSFKSAVTKLINRKQSLDIVIEDFGWQERFHDHVVRNEEEFNRISKYIRDNPINWKGV